MSSIAVVILNYNGKSYLEKFLPGVVSHSDDARIVVADNGSSDGSLSYLAAAFPTVTTIDNGSNLGFCGGYNAALQNVEADYFVLLNNDVEVTAGWLRPLRQLLDERPSVAAVQPRILSWHHRNRFEYAGAGGGMIDFLGYPFCRGRLFDTTEADRGQYNDTIPVFWATGACMVVRSTWYLRLGGLDEDFFAHMEEIDLCWRLKRAGNEVFYCSDSTVYHVGGGTLPAGNPRKTYYNFRNGFELLVKHLPVAKLVRCLPLRMALDWVAALRFLLSSPADAWAIVKAHLHVLSRIGRTLAKRRRLRREWGYAPVTGIYPRSVLVQYFLKGRKTYGELPHDTTASKRSAE